MLSNQILHKTVQDIKRITGLACAVWDMKGICLVMTNEHLLQRDKDVAEFLKKTVPDKSVTAQGAEAPKDRLGESCEELRADMGMFLVYDEDNPAYVLLLAGEPRRTEFAGDPRQAESAGNTKQMELAGRMGVSQITNLLYAYREKMDKNRFVQNLLLDNLLLVDVYNQAKAMKIAAELKRIVFVIQPKYEGDNLILETLKGLYATGTKDFVTAVDEKQVILVKALEKTDDYQKVNQIARELVDTLNMEAMVSVRVAYGTLVEELKDVSKSYKEADMALEVGRVFYVDKNILAYNELGIGRLIHQLPASLCTMFLKEVFGGSGSEEFEEEELTTVYTFFDNNLNISETARQLYVHRNTLVYRLEKIQKKTGLDVRVFEDALTFKIAMMVSDHMKYMND